MKFCAIKTLSTAIKHFKLLGCEDPRECFVIIELRGFGLFFYVPDILSLHRRGLSRRSNICQLLVAETVNHFAIRNVFTFLFLVVCFYRIYEKGIRVIGLSFFPFFVLIGYYGLWKIV
jgi:hypothetical protein